MVLHIIALCRGSGQFADWGKVENFSMNELRPEFRGSVAGNPILRDFLGRFH